MIRGVNRGLCVLVLCTMAQQALAQGPSCADRDFLAGKLSKEHAETQQGVGLTTDGRLVEVFASPSGTWTLLLTHPNGRSCVVTYGDSWHLVPAKDARPVS